jgi:hypothetical protein
MRFLLFASTELVFAEFDNGFAATLPASSDVKLVRSNLGAECTLAEFEPAFI